MTHRCLGHLDGVVRAYAWGSMTALAELRGHELSATPQAELWFGAHPAAPSTLERDGARQGLDAVIAAAPADELGSAVRLHGRQLPFLVKILAAEQPLSLQVHPDAAAARSGFDAEEARGVPTDAADRHFGDPWAKPEMLRAIRPFEALVGLRTADDARALLDRLDDAVFTDARRRLADDGAASWPRVLAGLLAVGAAATAAALDRLTAGRPPVGIEPAHWAWFTRLAAAYPHDPAVLVALLLNHVRLAPGEALALPAGTVHAYLGGLAVEAMAASDNVLRGGLTAKPVDVARFVDIVDARLRPEPTRGTPDDDGGVSLPSPAPHFAWRVFDGPLATTTPAAVQIGLCTAGRVEIDDGERTLALGPGGAYYTCAASPPADIRGDGTLHLITPGGVRAESGADGRSRRT